MLKPSLLLCTISLTAFASSASAQEMQGHVQKEHVRLERPQLALQTAAQAPLTSEISDTGFTLHAQTRMLNADAGMNMDWPQFPSGIERSYINAAPPMQAAAVSPDYNSIEQAYASSVQRPPMPRRAFGASQAGYQAALQSLPFGYMSAGLNAAQANTSLSGAPQVDADNCRCNTMIPTSQCMMGRLQGFGTNIVRSPSVSSCSGHFNAPAFHHMR